MLFYAALLALVALGPCFPVLRSPTANCTSLGSEAWSARSRPSLLR